MISTNLAKTQPVWTYLQYQQANRNCETNLQREKFFQPGKHRTLTQNNSNKCFKSSQPHSICISLTDSQDLHPKMMLIITYQSLLHIIVSLQLFIVRPTSVVLIFLMFIYQLANECNNDDDDDDYGDDDKANKLTLNND